METRSHHTNFLKRAHNHTAIISPVCIFRRQTTELASSSSQPLVPRHRQQQQQQQQLTSPVLQDSYMQSRAQALHSVESTIQELGNIFTQLATMVSQQGELAIRSPPPLLLPSMVNLLFFKNIKYDIIAHSCN